MPFFNINFNWVHPQTPILKPQTAISDGLTVNWYFNFNKRKISIMYNKLSQVQPNHHSSSLSLHPSSARPPSTTYSFTLSLQLLRGPPGFLLPWTFQFKIFFEILYTYPYHTNCWVVMSSIMSRFISAMRLIVCPFQIFQQLFSRNTFLWLLIYCTSVFAFRSHTSELYAFYN